MKSIIVWLTIAITATPAFAAGGFFRRRSFGGYCTTSHCAPKKQHTVREKVIQQVAVPQQVVNISNVYPAGSTVYGQQGVAQLGQLYGSNPTLAMQLASDNGRVWAEAFTAAVNSGTASNEAIARVAQVQAATAHLQAATAGTQGTRVESLQIKQGAGGIEVTRGQQTGDRQPRTGGGLLTAKCASCHGADQASPKGAVIIQSDYPLPADKAMRSLEILSGSNVPAAMKGLVDGMSDEEKGQLMEDLLSSWKRSE